MSSDKETIRRERLTGAGGVAAGGLAYLLDQTPNTWSPGLVDVIDTVSTTGWLTGCTLLGGAVGHGLWRQTRTAQRRNLFHAAGWAGRHNFVDVLGAKAIRRLGPMTRPSLEKRADRKGYKRRDTDYGQFLGRAVTGNRAVRSSKVFASFEQSLLLVAPPGMGKTALMLHSVLDAPGAVLTASTKPDVYVLTHQLRAQHGPVALFNPQGVGRLAGNFRWDPLIGCEHYQAATDRATALVKGTKAITAMQEASWGEKCVEILSKYLMAARLANQDLNSVAYWLANPSNEDAVRILRHFPDQVPAGWASALQAEMRSDADRMKGSIWSLARASVAFMSNPLIAAACSKGAGQSFNAAEFARTRGTLYLLGDDRDETIAPLLSALTSYVYEEVKMTATADEKERLDPPFGIFLDEVTKITPVPLAQWAADARGHGIYITAVTQTFDQIRERWGTLGAGAINTLFSRVVLGGIQNMEDLKELSELIGTRQVDAVSKGESESRSGRSRSRSTSTRVEVIMPPAEIRMLPRDHALVLTNEARAVVVKFRKGQIRATKELRKLHRAQVKADKASAARAERAAEVAGPPRPTEIVFGDALVAVPDNRSATRVDDEAGAA